jgi:hypothetical protein
MPGVLGNANILSINCFEYPKHANFDTVELYDFDDGVVLTNKECECEKEL